MTVTIRLVIAEDHAIVRRGIRMLIDHQEGMEVVGEAESGSECLAQVEELLPDVVLMDISMPEMDGFRAAELINERWPEVRVLGLTMHEEKRYVLRLLRAGAAGYVVKGAAPGDLLTAIETVADGEAYLEPQVAAMVVENVREREPRQPLSDREREVVRLIAEGLTGREIAERLVISPHTVERHRTNILRKLDVDNKVALVRYALREGLVQESSGTGISHTHRS